MGRRDEIGARGEALFTAAIMNFCGRPRPYFVSHFLGDKFKSLDFLVELVGADEGAPFLFVQVKTTTQGYTKRRGRRLKVGLTREDVLRMRAYPAPTYLVGIDEVNEKAFILSIDENTRGRISGMSTEHELDCRNLKVLRDEVAAYWAARDMRVRRSAFSVSVPHAKR
jgi:hypothetical protein